MVVPLRWIVAKRQVQRPRKASCVAETFWPETPKHWDPKLWFPELADTFPENIAVAEICRGDDMT
eukprot:Skav221327  [mRNA]  locus=scaffold1437:35358:38630:- [translate_table: standard]